MSSPCFWGFEPPGSSWRPFMAAHWRQVRSAQLSGIPGGIAQPRGKWYQMELSISIKRTFLDIMIMVYIIGILCNKYIYIYKWEYVANTMTDWFGTFFLQILGIIIPSDELIFFKLKPPTSFGVFLSVWNEIAKLFDEEYVWKQYNLKGLWPLNCIEIVSRIGFTTLPFLSWKNDRWFRDLRHLSHWEVTWNILQKQGQADKQLLDYLTMIDSPL